MIVGRRERKKKWAPLIPDGARFQPKRPEDEGIDTRDLEADRKQSDETENKES
jgi:hypothetical protein